MEEKILAFLEANGPSTLKQIYEACVGSTKEAGFDIPNYAKNTLFPLSVSGKIVKKADRYQLVEEVDGYVIKEDDYQFILAALLEYAELTTDPKKAVKAAFLAGSLSKKESVQNRVAALTSPAIAESRTTSKEQMLETIKTEVFEGNLDMKVLSEKSGVSYGFIENILRGNAFPAQDTLQKLIRGYQSHLEDLAFLSAAGDVLCSETLNA